MPTDLEIRPLEANDAPELHALRAHPEIAPVLLGPTCESVEAVRARLEAGAPHGVQIAATARGRIVGFGELEILSPVRCRHAARLQLAVAPPFRGRGAERALLDALLDSADRWLDVVRVDTEVVADQAPALVLLQKHGFEIEAHKRGDARRDGSFGDVLLLGRIRPGWSQAPGALRPSPPWPTPGRTPRGAVSIRALAPDDAAAMAEVLRDPIVRWGTMQLPFVPATLWRQRLEQNDPAKVQGFAAEVEGRMVGSISLLRAPEPCRSHVRRLGMSVHAEYQGMGIGDRLFRHALEVADARGVGRVELEVYRDNLRAQRLYEKHGFAVEGARRFAVWRDGGYVGSLVMARVRTVG